MTWLVGVLIVVGYSGLVRLVYYRGKATGWEKGFKDGYALADNHHREVWRNFKESGL